MTLPYTYKSIASSLPPSITTAPASTSAGPVNGSNNPATIGGKTRYVVSSTGSHVAHPEEILASCQALEAHLKKTITDAERTIKDWEESIRERELAEKRRLAPGWLDREEKLLQPAVAAAAVAAAAAATATAAGAGGHHVSAGSTSSSAAAGVAHDNMNILDSTTREQEVQSMPAMAPHDEGEELDRAFGALSTK